VKLLAAGAMGVWGQSPQSPEAKHPVLGDFYNFIIKITHFYAYYGQNSYFKAILHQLKAFKLAHQCVVLRLQHLPCSR